MRYIVQVLGKNFLVQFDGEPDAQVYGFLSLIDVDADDVAGAEVAAISLLRQSPNLRSLVRNTRDNPPQMFVEEMHTYESGPTRPLTVDPTLIWFPEDGSEDG